MADKDWKQAERRAAKLFGGRRFPANSGHRIDGESAIFVWQVKQRKNHTMADMFNLASEMEEYGSSKEKIGMVYLEDKPGRGNTRKDLVVMTSGMFKQLFPTQKESKS